MRTSIYVGQKLRKRMDKAPELNWSALTVPVIEYALDALDARKKSHPKESSEQRARQIQADVVWLCGPQELSPED